MWSLVGSLSLRPQGHASRAVSFRTYWTFFICPPSLPLSPRLSKHQDGASLERARILVRSIGKAIVNVRIYPNTKLVLESPKRVFVTAIDADQLPVTVLITLHDARAFLETVTEIQHRLTAAEAP